MPFINPSHHKALILLYNLGSTNKAPELCQDGMFAEAFKEQIPACSAVISNHSSGIDCSLSGSTGVLALIQANRWLTVANVGDSRCFIGGVDEHGECYSVPLSTDHTPMLASEAKRIYGCKVCSAVAAVCVHLCRWPFRGAGVSLKTQQMHNIAI